ncbi:MAG: hypothetical protein ACI9UH_000885 [Gammaproteobacteria bacterium]|jgi:hypothetical protein
MVSERVKSFFLPNRTDVKQKNQQLHAQMIGRRISVFWV